MITKPMLAGKCTDKGKIQFPVLATPKLDGVRCLVINGQAISRKFKPIPNPYIREEIEKYFPDGCDGELMIPGKAFGEATGIIMSSKSGKPEDAQNFEYWVFDLVVRGRTGVPYEERMKDLDFLDENKPHLKKILPLWIYSQEELDSFEKKCLEEGYEGVMIRDPEGPYKNGRSTEREGYLLKIKQFKHGEAVIIGFEEKMHNQNEAKEDAFGYTERSHHKDGMLPSGTLGSLIVRDLKTQVEFSIGTGFDDEKRLEIWTSKKEYLGKIARYKYQPYGVKDAPRFPVFDGIRHPDDM